MKGLQIINWKRFGIKLGNGQLYSGWLVNLVVKKPCYGWSSVKIENILLFLFNYFYKINAWVAKKSLILAKKLRTRILLLLLELTYLKEKNPRLEKNWSRGEKSSVDFHWTLLQNQKLEVVKNVYFFAKNRLLAVKASSY